MKKYLLAACCFCAISASALSLNAESKQEARLFKQFLEAVYAQREQDPHAFNYLQKALE